MTEHLKRPPCAAEAAAIVQSAGTAAPSAGKAPELGSFPASQTAGIGWIIAVLDDLVRFSEFAGLADTRDVLSKARVVAIADIRLRAGSAD